MCVDACLGQLIEDNHLARTEDAEDTEAFVTSYFTLPTSYFI